jgi:hypothetical protein
LDVKDLFAGMSFARFGGIMLVAVIAGIGGIVYLVATLAGNGPLPAVVERKGVTRQAGRPPGLAAVAAGAIQTKETGVNGRLGMAAGTIRGRAGELLLLVAAGTRSTAVYPLKWEDGLVVELDHPIHAVMALTAVVAKEGGVFLGKKRFPGRVARKAGSSLGQPLPLAVTIGAKQRRAVVVQLVPVQVEAGQPIVVEGRKIHPVDIGLRPLVLSVAQGAAAGVRQTAVQTCAALPLLCHSLVALLAAVAAGAPPRFVTLGALPFQVGMAAGAAQHVTPRGSGAQWSWAKRFPSPQIEGDAQGNDQQGSGAAAKR